MQQFLILNIKRFLKGKIVLTLFVLTGLIYAFMLSETIPKVVSFSGEMKILDMMPAGYNISYVNELFTRLGEPGRNAYLYEQIPFDLIYPAVYGIGFCLLLAWFLDKIGKLNGAFIYLCVLPVFAGFFDYCENTGIILMLKSFPEMSSNLVKITNVFSILKSSLTTLYFFILISVIFVFGIQTLLLKRKSK